MTNFDYILEQIKAGKMNAEQMEDFIADGTFHSLECDCTACRKKFLELRYVPYIKSCPFCHSSATRLVQSPYTERFYVSCDTCGAKSGDHEMEVSAAESWNSIRRETK